MESGRQAAWSAAFSPEPPAAISKLKEQFARQAKLDEKQAAKGAAKAKADAQEKAREEKQKEKRTKTITATAASGAREGRVRQQDLSSTARVFQQRPGEVGREVWSGPL